MQFVGVSTLLAVWPDADCPAYCASKAALSMAFRAFRLRYRGDPAAFKLLYLGPVHTAINPRFDVSSPPGPGVAPPADVARAVANRVLPGRGFAYYYPRRVGWICRWGGWMPDRLFETLTRPLRR